MLLVYQIKQLVKARPTMCCIRLVSIINRAVLRFQDYKQQVMVLGVNES